MGRAWNETHRERKRAYDRERHKQVRAARTPEQRRQENKRRWRLRKRKRRAERLVVFERDGFRCAYCRGVFGAEQLDVDHKYPRSRGGTDVESNRITACKMCNRKKGALTYEQFMAKIDPSFTPAWVVDDDARV